MIKPEFDFSDVVFGWNSDGFWFSCDHHLNYEAFVTFFMRLF